jgi:Flp pilus assembly protein TadD
MGWLWLLLFAAGAIALLAVLGVRRSLLSSVAAALMLGAAGYAWQGSPTLTGASPNPRAEALPDDPETIALRDAMFGRFTLDGAYLVASDAMSASGDDKAAIRALLGGLNRLPNSYALWTALGTAYSRHDGGQVSPAARFAFNRARRLAPQQPAVSFFEGLAFARAGDLAAVKPFWLDALRLTPANAPYRRDIAIRLVLLDRFTQMQQGAPAAR